MADLSAPSKLRRLIEESGYAFAVIEEAVDALRGQLGELAPGDPDVVEVLRAHLLAIGSPSDVLKFFSLELLERIDPQAAEEVYLEATHALARSPIQPERTYPVERAMIRKLGDRKGVRALPALAVLASREVYPLSRTAARAVAAIVGSTDKEAITERLKRDDLPEASAPDSLGEGVSRALWPSKRSSAKSSQERRRQLTLQNALPLGGSQGGLRPEGDRTRQRRLWAILRAAERDPARCGNCDQVTGDTRIGHMVPASRGGSDLPGNLVALCGECRRKLPRSREDAFEDDGHPTGTDVTQLSLF
jgi:5-methylcytosine-specific restriction endonuclease McrA